MTSKWITAGLISAASLLSGCTYAGVATAGEWAVVTKNVFGVSTKVYVCKITPTGLTQCSENESP